MDSKNPQSPAGSADKSPAGQRSPTNKSPAPSVNEERKEEKASSPEKEASSSPRRRRSNVEKKRKRKKDSRRRSRSSSVLSTSPEVDKSRRKRRQDSRRGRRRKGRSRSSASGVSGISRRAGSMERFDIARIEGKLDLLADSHHRILEGAVGSRERSRDFFMGERRSLRRNAFAEKRRGGQTSEGELGSGARLENVLEMGAEDESMGVKDREEEEKRALYNARLQAIVDGPDLIVTEVDDIRSVSSRVSSITEGDRAPVVGEEGSSPVNKTSWLVSQMKDDGTTAPVGVDITTGFDVSFVNETRVPPSKMNRTLIGRHKISEIKSNANLHGSVKTVPVPARFVTKDRMHLFHEEERRQVFLACSESPPDMEQRREGGTRDCELRAEEEQIRTRIKAKFATKDWGSLHQWGDGTVDAQSASDACCTIKCFETSRNDRLHITLRAIAKETDIQLVYNEKEGGTEELRKLTHEQYNNKTLRRICLAPSPWLAFQHESDQDPQKPPIDLVVGPDVGETPVRMTQIIWSSDLEMERAIEKGSWKPLDRSGKPKSTARTSIVCTKNNKLPLEVEPRNTWAIHVSPTFAASKKAKLGFAGTGILEIPAQGVQRRDIRILGVVVSPHRVKMIRSKIIPEKDHSTREEEGVSDFMNFAASLAETDQWLEDADDERSPQMGGHEKASELVLPVNKQELREKRVRRAALEKVREQEWEHAFGSTGIGTNGMDHGRQNYRAPVLRRPQPPLHSPPVARPPVSLIPGPQRSRHDHSSFPEDLMGNNTAPSSSSTSQVTALGMRRPAAWSPGVPLREGQLGSGGRPTSRRQGTDSRDRSRNRSGSSERVNMEIGGGGLRGYSDWSETNPLLPQTITYRRSMGFKGGHQKGGNRGGGTGRAPQRWKGGR